MIKIVCTGPESSGKTTLAKQLADYYQTLWVSEYARHYLSRLTREYNQADLLEIAKGQWMLEETYSQAAKEFVVFDTSFLVLKVWSEVRYNNCDPFIEERFLEDGDKFYILCDFEIPWEYDPLREHPDQRGELYKRYKEALVKHGKKYLEVKGSPEERLKQVTDWLSQTVL